MSTTARTDRFPLVDSMRAIAALIVVLYHADKLAPPGAPGSLKDYVNHFNLGVPIFFVISGFLLYRPFVSARLAGTKPVDWRSYLVRRALRILPAYWVALTVLTVAFDLPGVFTKDWWRYYGLVQIYSQRTIDQGMGVAWTLCIEATFYICLPLFDALVRWVSARLKHADLKLIAAGWLIAVAFNLIGYAVGWGGWSVLNLIGTFDWFAMGMAAAVLTVAAPAGRQWLRLRYPAVCWLVAAVAFAVIVRIDAPEGLRADPIEHIGNGFVAIALFVPAIYGGGLVGRFLSLRSLRWVGLVSYGVYLYHASIIPTLRDHRIPERLPGNGWVNMTVVTLAIVIPLAALSYYGFEARLAALAGRRRRRASVVARPADVTT